MAQNNGFGAERLERQAGILQRLAFSMLEERLETSVVSAPSPLAASSKLVRVRVEDS